MFCFGREGLDATVSLCDQWREDKDSYLAV